MYLINCNIKFWIKLFRSKIDLKEIDTILDSLRMSSYENIFVNQGPGKFSSIRISISIAKSISLAKNISLFGFNSNDLVNGDYNKILELHKKNLLIKDLIKPLYSS